MFLWMSLRCMAFIAFSGLPCIILFSLRGMAFIDFQCFFLFVYSCFVWEVLLSVMSSFLCFFLPASSSASIGFELGFSSSTCSWSWVWVIGFYGFPNNPIGNQNKGAGEPWPTHAIQRGTHTNPDKGLWAWWPTEVLQRIFPMDLEKRRGRGDQQRRTKGEP